MLLSAVCVAIVSLWAKLKFLLVLFLPLFIIGLFSKLMPLPACSASMLAFPAYPPFPNFLCRLPSQLPTLISDCLFWFLFHLFLSIHTLLSPIPSLLYSCVGPCVPPICRFSAICLFSVIQSSVGLYYISLKYFTFVLFLSLHLSPTSNFELIIQRYDAELSQYLRG